MSVSANVLAQHNKVKVGSYLTPGLITVDGDGMFNQLHNAIFNEINQANELSLSSIKRAKQGINTGDLDAYFPELWENLPGDKNNYLVSNPIFYKRIVLFTRKNSGLTNLTDLENKLLGAVKGFSYGKEIKTNPNLKLIFQDNDVTNIRLLLKNRIKGVLGGFPGTVLAVKNNKASNQIHYDLNKPVAVLESFYVCKNNKKGKALCGAINKGIKSLQEKNQLALNPITGASKFTPSVPAL